MKECSVVYRVCYNIQWNVLGIDIEFLTKFKHDDCVSGLTTFLNYFEVNVWKRNGVAVPIYYMKMNKIIQ